MRKFALGLGCLAMLGAASTSWAALGVVVDEDFESYADTAAMSAVWAGFDGTLINEIDDDGDLTPEVSGIGNFAFHPGGSVNELTLATPVVATVDEWVQVTVDIYNNATDLDPFFPLNPGNKRMSFGLRGNDGVATENIVELGMYNAVFGEHLSYRGILFPNGGGGSNPNWGGFDLGTEERDVNGDGVITPDNGDTVIDPGEEPLDPDLDGILQPWHNEDDAPVNVYKGAAWHTFRATIKADSVVYEVDYDYDGTFNTTVEHLDMLHTAQGFNKLRFGSPSGISSGGGGVTFDNIKLEIIAAVSALPGDLDGDGFVGLADLDIVLLDWNNGNTIPPALGPINDPRADPTGDGFVGLEDLDIVLLNWNTGTPPAVAVPEPATLGLIALGGLAMLRRR